MSAPRWWQLERMAIERMEDAILGLKPEPVVCDKSGYEFCDNPACVPCNDRARWHHEDNMDSRQGGE